MCFTIECNSGSNTNVHVQQVHVSTPKHRLVHDLQSLVQQAQFGVGNDKVVL
jgi:hypothetical protein